MADNDQSLTAENQKPSQDPIKILDQPTTILVEEESKTANNPQENSRQGIYHDDTAQVEDIETARKPEENKFRRKDDEDPDSRQRPIFKKRRQLVPTEKPYAEIIPISNAVERFDVGFAEEISIPEDSEKVGNIFIPEDGEKVLRNPLDQTTRELLQASPDPHTK